MDKIILDFSGDRLVLTSGIGSLMTLSQKGMKIEHSGEMWKVVDRHVEGVDELAQAEALWKKGDDPVKSEVAIVITLEKI